MFDLRCDRAVFVAVLCTGLSLCAASAASAASGTGGAAMPKVLPATTGGMGYGDPGTQSLVVEPIAVLHRRIVARARIRSTGRFEVSWTADRVGRISLRAIVSGRRRASASSSAAPIARVTVYRAGRATFYGPGFFGQQTACGQTLTPDMHGVAHKQLPCGTLVAMTYGGRQIVVPVIDRGPFHTGYSWDLTQATADALGFTAIGAGEIGYVRVKPARAG